MSVRRCVTLLFALGGAVALVIMHGATAHGLELPHLASATAMTADVVVPDGHADGHADGHDHDAHQHDDGQPCQACGHGAAALCALIVLGVAVVPRRATAAVGYVAAAAPQPPLRNWSPDPPVPKFALVIPAI